jgi:hypothetical protein
MTTTVSKMGKMKPLSPEWFDASFEGMNVPEFAKYASIRICKSYGIIGQSDPGYIANVIAQEIKFENQIKEIK